MREPRAPRSFEDFERRLSAALDDAPHPPLALRAATLARQGGACDVIITAALVHDYAGLVEAVPGPGDAAQSAELLRHVFEAPVGRLLRGLQALRSPTSPSSPSKVAPSHQCARLARFLDAAQASNDPVLALPRLLAVARRMSRDG